jgi:hypothetical protein
VLPLPGLGRLRAGAVVHYDNRRFVVTLVGSGQVLLVDENGNHSRLTVENVESYVVKDCST